MRIYVNIVLYGKEIWYPFQNNLDADEWLIKHEGNILVIITFDLHTKTFYFRWDISKSQVSFFLHNFSSLEILETITYQNIKLLWMITFDWRCVWWVSVCLPSLFVLTGNVQANEVFHKFFFLIQFKKHLCTIENCTNYTHFSFR